MCPAFVLRARASRRAPAAAAMAGLLQQTCLERTKAPLQLCEQLHAILEHRRDAVDTAKDVSRLLPLEEGELLSPRVGIVGAAEEVSKHHYRLLARVVRDRQRVL